MALDRLVEELKTKLRAIDAVPRGMFPAGVHGLTITAGASASEPYGLTLERIHVVDMDSGDVDVRLPFARQGDEGKAVGILRVQTGGALTVYGSGAQLVSRAATEAVVTAGLRAYVWCGGDAGDDQRNWRLVT